MATGSFSFNYSLELKGSEEERISVACGEHTPLCCVELGPFL